MRLAILTLGLIIGGQAIPASGQTTLATPRSIVVDGYGEVKTMPDVATISYTLRGEGATSDDALRAMVASGKRIEAALGSIDSAAEPRTSKVVISPARASTCRDNDYDSSEQLSKGACAIVGYVATQSVTVDTADVKAAGTMTGLVGRGGADDARIESFKLSDPRAAKAKAIAAALVDAQGKAAAIATGSHTPLGRIITISTVDRSVETLTNQEIQVTGQRKSANMTSPTPVTVSVNPEPITTSANITVTYAIGE